MAINKVVNKKTTSHGAMRNVISYVLRGDKVKEGCVDITGPYEHEVINWDHIYRAFLHEKRLWDKDSGRMYAHNIISFHRDEAVTPDMCMRIGRAFADQFFPEHQNLIGVHQDKHHLHIHIITNSVSFIDGRKLHQTRRDLERQKDFTNKLCEGLGLSVTEKGKHFDGSAMEEGEIRAWSKDKYNLLRNETKKSFVADCAIAVMESVSEAVDRDSFIRAMAHRGWTVNWQDRRKHIVFENESGEKVRDSNISKTFNMDIGKEALLNEFERQAAHRKEHIRAEQESGELDRYYADIEAAIQGAGVVIESAGHDPGTDRGSVIPSGTAGNREMQNSGGSGENIDAFLSELDAAIRSAGNAIDNGTAQRRAVLRAKSESKDRERERRSKERQGPADPGIAGPAAAGKRRSKRRER